MDDLATITTELAAIREAGRVLSTVTRDRLTAIRARLEALAYHPEVAGALVDCDELLALPDALPDPIHESLTESTHIWEAAPGDKSGRLWDVVLITAGGSKNGRFYPTSTLRKAAPLFENVYAYANHQSDEARRSGQDRDIRDKVGKFTRVAYGKIGDAEGLRARFTVVAPWLREALVEAADAGEHDFYGFSIDAVGAVEPRTIDNRRWNYVKAIEGVNSADVVSNPAAGGRIERLVASVGARTGVESMEPEELSKLVADQVTAAVAAAMATSAATITEAVKPGLDEISELRAEIAKQKAEGRLTVALEGSKLSDISKGSLRREYRRLIESGVAFTDDDLKASIEEAVGLEQANAKFFAKAPLSLIPAGDVAGGVTEADMKRKRLALALDERNGGWTHEGTRPYSGLRESYCDWNNLSYFDTNPADVVDAMFVRYDSERDTKRITESLTTATWGQVFADELYNQLTLNYRRAPFYDSWRPVVSSIRNVPDFRTQHYTMFGGYADLSTVAEQGTYTTFTSPGDDEVTWAVTKRGNLEDVTMESIANDHIGAISQIPRKMADAAARTLFKFVMNFITTDNPNWDVDAVALYNSAHANTGTTALTLDSVAAVRAAMMIQTRYGTAAEVLGVSNAPKYLIVPPQLEMLAKRILNPSGIYNLSPTSSADASIDPQSFAGMGMEVLVQPHFTDVTDWFAVADPNLVDNFVLGFYGSVEPQLFTQDMDQVGAVFTADKISFKVRHIYGGDILDYRPFYRQVVAG